MTFRSLFAACFCLVVLGALTVGAQMTSTTDPVSGNWGDPNGIGFDLKFDGKSAVSGTIRVVAGGTMRKPEIKAGLFNPATGALKLEGDTEAPDGSPAHFLIEGKIDKDEVAGVYFIAGNKGDFRFTRQPGVAFKLG